jgi:hypothetical protein
MDNSTPPVLQPTVQKKKRSIGVVFLFVSIILILLITTFVLVPAFFGAVMFGWLSNAGQLNIRLHDDKFSVTVLEVKSEPNYFIEKVRVRCEKDMDVGIWVTDLKNAGFLEITGENGEKFYQQSQPHKVGQSASIKAKDGFSTCEILFKVNTASNSTSWHSEVAGGTCDTSLQSPLTVSDIQTNWPSTYNRGSDIPLASLGDYKILLSIK